MKYELAYKIRTDLGEGVVWDDRRKVLFWIDIVKKELHRLTGGRDELLKVFPDFLGFCAPCEDGRLAIGCGRQLILFDPDTLLEQPLCSVDGEFPKNRFNDGKCTPEGRILAGTMSTALNESGGKAGKDGGLYLLQSGRQPEKLKGDMLVPNGLAFSPDHKTLYHTDTWSQTICAYDWNGETGSISNCRAAVEIPAEKGAPDGFTIAEDGTLFVALWGAGALGRFDPKTGRELSRTQLPARHVTCCCFGGEGLDELYVTTSGQDAPEEEYPLAGSLFCIKPGVRGMKAHRFKL